MPNTNNHNNNGFVENDRSFELTRMKQIHHEIALHALLGYKNVEIADKLDVSEVMVGYTLRSPIVQKKLDILRKERDIRALDVPEQLKETAPVAFAEMQKMLVDPHTGETNRRKVAEYILNSAGYGPKQQEQDSGGLSTKEINKIKDIAKDKGYLVEVEEAEVVDESENEKVA